MILKDKLLEKSKEAFIMAIEIYNKPTIKYRVEGFSFFICNAWELMLKAHLLATRGESSIYYADNPKRTISLENCLQQVITNAKAPVRRNLVKIVTMPPTAAQMMIKAVAFLFLSSHILPICCILILETPVYYRARCNAWRSRARKVISCRHPSCTNDWRFSARILMKIPALTGFPQGWQSLPASPFSALPFQKGEDIWQTKNETHKESISGPKGPILLMR